MFIVNVPIGLVVVPFDTRLLTRAGGASNRGSGKRPQLDPFGVVLLGIGLVSLLLPLVEHGPLPALRVAVVLRALFVQWERRVRARCNTPVVDLRLLKPRSFSIGSLPAHVRSARSGGAAGARCRPCMAVRHTRTP